MKLCHQGKTLCISDVPELGLANTGNFFAELGDALATGAENIVIDLSATVFMDCSGLGALIALRNHAHLSPVRLNLINPTPLVRRLLKLTRLEHLLEPAACAHAQT